MSDTLGAVDAAWYRLDHQGNAADIVALLTFQAALDFEALTPVLLSHLSRYAPLTHRVVDRRVGSPRWEPVATDSLSQQVRRVRLDEPGDEPLQALVSQILTDTLARDRPLWELHLVERPSGSAIIAKIHHCLGDGFALVGVLLSLCDSPRVQGAQAQAQAQGQDQRQDQAPGLPPEEPSRAAALREALERRAQRALQGGQVAQTLGELMMLPFDTPSSLRRPLTGRRRAAWSRAIPLSRFKALARERGCTLNDVLLGALSGALRAWLDARGDSPDTQRLRAIVPVNLRAAHDIGQALGNQFGLVFLELPVHEADASDRLRAVHDAMEGLKRGHEAVGSSLVLHALGLAPELIEQLAAEIFTRKGSLVVTNVPGPRQRLTLAGQEVDQLMFWVPHPALLGLGVSLLSYADEVRVGVRADEGITDDPGALVSAFEEELDRLSHEAP